ncbi:MAG: DUF4292 domain-containing protein [Bacteriovoracia bacterium]
MILLSVYFFSSCTKNVKPFSEDWAFRSIEKQSAAFKTVSGQAWITAKSKEGKVSIPSEIWFDRTNEFSQKARIDATDIVGVTHFILVVDSERKMSWIDFDQRKKFSAREYWVGLPLVFLPELLLGLSSIKKQDIQIVSIEDQVVELKLKNRVEYEHIEKVWLEFEAAEENRFNLVSIRGKTKFGEFSARFSDFRREEDFELPTKIKIIAKTNEDLEIDVAWRNRTFNESVSPKVFNVPKLDW